MAKKRIGWLSRHAPGEERLAELQRLFGTDCEIVIDSRLLSKTDGAGDAISRINAGQFDEIVLVAPMSIVRELTARGVQPIWPRMDATGTRFLGFERILKVRVEFEEVAPSAGVRKIMWLSGFAPTQSQIVELRRLYGAGVSIVHERSRNVEEAARRFFQHRCDLMVAVVPMAVLERLSAFEHPRPLPLLWSEAAPENDPARAEFRGADGRGYRFARYRKVAVKVEAVRL